jgi:hypothetical protein
MVRLCLQRNGEGWGGEPQSFLHIPSTGPKYNRAGVLVCAKLHTFEQVVKVGRMVKTNYIGSIGDCRDLRRPCGLVFSPRWQHEILPAFCLRSCRAYLS